MCGRYIAACGRPTPLAGWLRGKKIILNESQFITTILLRQLIYLLDGPTRSWWWQDLEGQRTGSGERTESVE